MNVTAVMAEALPDELSAELVADDLLEFVASARR
jgi:hypothetical protein